MSTADDGELPMTRKHSSLIAAHKEMELRMEIDQRREEHRKGKGKKGEKAKADARKAYATKAHTFSREELASEYDVDLKEGLADDQVTTLREKWGLNQLTPRKEKPWWWKLLMSIFSGFFNQLLWAGSLLCFIAYGVAPEDIKDETYVYLGAVLSFVVTVTGIFGYYQESKSQSIMESLSASFAAADVPAYRNGGEVVNIPAAELVPGDIIGLKYGMKIPADVRVFECSPDMLVDNSSLTGESEAQPRKWVVSQEKIPTEANNLCFFGTLLLKGTGKGVVIKTGDHTYMGGIAKIAEDTENVETPIALEIKDFVAKVSLIAFALGISFFIVGMVDNGNPIKNIVFLIGIIVANVPEGLLATVTVSLTLTAHRMGAKNVRVKNLESVETLGSTSVICSDKTGTLTTNVMTVAHVYFDFLERQCETISPWEAIMGDFYEADGVTRKPSLLKLLRIGGLCNNAKFTRNEKGEIEVQTDATEKAVVKFCAGHVNSEYHMKIQNYMEAMPKLHEIPFNSTNKWQVSIHQMPQDVERPEVGPKRALVVLKGAPERVLAMCDRHLVEGRVQEMNAADKDRVMGGVEALGKRGERVLAFAELELDERDYNINMPEPATEQYSQDVAPGATNWVYVMYQGKRHQITLDKTKLVQNEDGQDQIINLRPEQHTIGMVKEEVFRVTNIKPAMQRLYFGNEGVLEDSPQLNDLSIKAGHTFHLKEGSYKFAGTNRDNCNWPFGRPGEQGLVFVGLMAMIDPPRPGVPEAVHKCQTAGIKVVMVTGDHPVTAKAIARKVGIIDPSAETIEDLADRKYGGNMDDITEADLEEVQAVVTPGSKLQEELDKGEVSVRKFWNRVLTKPMVVFARSSPQQKLLIVEACQHRGGIVAVTGDGVNDSPALKKADIGVAMGITGTDVAKDSADMILVDDNFASIVNGVEEGRIIFDNLKKSIAYTLSSNIPEIAPFLLFQVVGIPLALSTQMILLVDLGTDLAPAISLAHEGKELDIMKRPPRDPNHDKLVTWKLVSFSYLQIGMLQALAGFYAYIVVLNANGISPYFLPGLDSEDIFGKHTDSDVQFDAHWLWCFDNDWKDKPDNCLYTPYYWSEEWVDRDETYAEEVMDYAKDTLKLPITIKDAGSAAQAKANYNQMINEFVKYAYQPEHYADRRCKSGEYTDAEPVILRTFCTNGRTAPDRMFPMSMEDRDVVLRKSNSAYFISIIVVQWADLMICKTRIRSLFEQGMTNEFMNWSLIFETALGAFLIYVPFANTMTLTSSIEFLWWTSAVPFAILIYIYDECRKGWIRKHRNGWLERNTYW